MTLTDYTRIAASYDAHYLRAIDRAEDAVLVSLLGDVRGRSVLDVGCGTGHLLDLVQPLSYLGVDKNRAMIDVARSKHPMRNLWHGDACDCSPDWGVRHWDVTACLWAFPHFPDHEQALRNMHASTRPGGQVLVMAYTARYPGREHSVDDPATYTTHTPSQLHALMTGTGWHGVRIRPFRVLPDDTVGAWPERWLKRLFRAELLLPPRTPAYVLIGTASP